MGGIYMHSKLINMINNNELVAIYSDENNTENFMVGYIRKLTEDKLMIINVGIHGEYDGFSGIYVNDIFRIETNSKYLKKIALLQSYDANDLIIADEYEDVFENLIRMAINKKHITAISFLNGEEIRGFITECDDSINVLEIDDYGEKDGENIIKFNTIKKIVIDDIECRAIEKLYNYKHKKFKNNYKL